MNYFSFQWHITDECDQRCKHCYIFSGEGCKELTSMTWKQMQEVVANCEDFCKVYNRKPYFYITGGDPILHPDFWKLMALLKSRDIPFTLMGNPFHLDDEICRMLKVCGCEKYQMSLDGMRETHDWFRKPGSFDLTLEKIGCLNRAGIKSIIMSTVSKTNRKEIPDIIDAVVKAKVKVFAFARYVPTGGEVDTSMTPQEYRELLEICDAQYKAYEEAGCETYFNKKDHLWTLYEYETGQFKLPTDAKEDMIYGGCNCGNCHITIASNGDVMACRRVTDSKMANVFEDRLADVWVCQMEKYREYDKFKKCSKCELKAWCRGCPAVANGTNAEPSTIDDPTIQNGFYDAPTVVCVFCQDNFLLKTADAFCLMENMILQATELGIASCIISRGYETFDSEEGRRLMIEWEVPQGYTCQGFVILGYIDGEQPHSKPRKPGRIKVIM